MSITEKGEKMNASYIPKQKKKLGAAELITNIIVYGFLGLWAIVVLFPFYWMILSSFKSYSEYSSEYVPKFFTLSPTVENYIKAFSDVPLGKYFLNTVIFTVATTALMMVVITLAAYAFARLNFKGKNLVFTLFLSLMMIPNELVIITNFVPLQIWICVTPLWVLFSPRSHRYSTYIC